jgi:hypothetical protein
MEEQQRRAKSTTETTRLSCWVSADVPARPRFERLRDKRIKELEEVGMGWDGNGERLLGMSFTMFYHVIPCFTMFYHVIPCYTMLYHVIPCYTMLYTE